MDPCVGFGTGGSKAITKHANFLSVMFVDGLLRYTMPTYDSDIYCPYHHTVLRTYFPYLSSLNQRNLVA
jgi:hypothetical protein